MYVAIVFIGCIEKQLRCYQMRDFNPATIRYLLTITRDLDLFLGVIFVCTMVQKSYLFSEHCIHIQLEVFTYSRLQNYHENKRVNNSH